MKIQANPPPKKISILIVEDSPTQAEYLNYLLDQNGYLVNVAINGRQTLDLLEHIDPDLIISDINMPEMNGYELCQNIKASAKNGDIPVILLTALSNPEDVLEGLECGADSFITKPFNTDYLLGHIQQLLANWKFHQTDRVRIGVEILFAGKRRFISANQQQMLGLLLSTYEAAVQRNNELIDTQDELKLLNESLEDKVVERTGELTVEITKRIQIEEALSASEAELRALFAAMEDLVLTIDKDGIYRKVAPTNPKLLFDSVENLLGKSLMDVFPADEAEKFLVVVREVLANGDLKQVEYLMLIADSPRWFSASITRLSADLTVWVVRDITQRKLAEVEISHRLKELESLFATSQVIVRPLEPREIGAKILEILMDRLSWNHATIRRYNPENQSIELLAFKQKGVLSETERLATEERMRKMITKPGQGIAGWVIEHGQTVFCEDVTKDPRYIQVESEIRSGIYVPLKIHERIIGCLSVESEHLHAFSETDEWLIATLAAQAASALENARLFAETQRRLMQTLALREIDQAISGSVDLDIVLDIALKHVLDELRVDAAVILQKNPHNDFLQYRCGKGLRTDALQFTSLRVGDGYAGQVVLKRQIINIPDLQGSGSNFLRSLNFSQEGFVCYFGVPLIAKGEINGVLEIYNRSPLNPDKERLDFMETLAGQIAIAIDSATLYEDLQQSNNELTLAYDATIEGWSHALDLRDKETEGHTQRVTDLTMRLAWSMGISEEDMIHIRRGALLHDIGKLGVPDNILLKPGPLTDEEWVSMRKHPQFALEMLSPITYLHSALDIPYCHHERWDGTGYPRGLQKEEIPLSARIFALIDVWDALISDRPYRKAWTKEKALNYIKEETGHHFDPQVVEAFLSSTSFWDYPEPSR